MDGNTILDKIGLRKRLLRVRKSLRLLIVAGAWARIRRYRRAKTHIKL